MYLNVQGRSNFFNWGWIRQFLLFWSFVSRQIRSFESSKAFLKKSPWHPHERMPAREITNLLVSNWIWFHIIIHVFAGDKTPLLGCERICSKKGFSGCEWKSRRRRNGTTIRILTIGFRSFHCLKDFSRLLLASECEDSPAASPFLFHFLESCNVLCNKTEL